MIPHNIITAATEKVAADRAVKNIRKALKAGNLEEANRLARMYGQAGVLKDTPAGIQAFPSLRKSHLGGAAEGNVVQVIDPRGIAARKMFHQGGHLDHPQLRADKANFFRAMEGHPNVPRLYGEYEGGKGPMHKVEFIPGREATRADLRVEPQGLRERFKAWVKGPEPVSGPEPAGAQIRRLVGDADRRGHVVQDVTHNPGNTRITPDGRAIVVDPMAMSKREYLAKKPAQAVYVNDIIDIHYPQGPPIMGRAEKVLPQVKRLGPGSRQAPKVRGAKVPSGGPEALRARLGVAAKGAPTPSIPTPTVAPAPAPSGASFYRAPTIGKPAPTWPPLPTAAAATGVDWKRRALMGAGGLAVAGGLGLLGHHLLTKRNEQENKKKKQRKP
jgi:hypothetical protein